MHFFACLSLTNLQTRSLPDVSKSPLERGWRMIGQVEGKTPVVISCGQILDVGVAASGDVVSLVDDLLVIGVGHSVLG